MEKPSAVTKEGLIQQIKYLKAPTCNKSEQHDEKFSVVCIDNRCDKSKQFDALCEICEIENVHKQEQHKTQNLKQFLLNLAENIFEEKKSNSNDQQAQSSGDHSLKSMIDSILLYLKEQNNNIGNLIAGLENLKTVVCQQNEPDGPQNQLKHIIQNISQKNKDSEEFLNQLKQFQGLIHIQPNNTLELSCKSANQTTMLQSLLQKLTFLKLNIDQIHTADLMKLLVNSKLPAPDQPKEQSQSSEGQSLMADFTSGFLKDEQIMFVTIVLKVVRNLSYIPKKQIIVCDQKDKCKVEGHITFWKKLYGAIGVDMCNLKGIVDSIVNDSINWLQIKLDDESFLGGCEDCSEHIKQLIHMIEINQVNTNSSDFMEQLKDVFRILNKMQGFTKQQVTKCQQENACKNKEAHITFWGKMWEEAWFWMNENCMGKAIQQGLDWMSDQIESEENSWDECEVCKSVLVEMRDKVQKLSANMENKQLFIKDVCLEVLNPQVFPVHFETF